MYWYEYSETRTGIPRNQSAQVDATTRRAPGDAPTLKGAPAPTSSLGGASGDLAHTSTGHSHSGSAPGRLLWRSGQLPSRRHQFNTTHRTPSWPQV